MASLASLVNLGSLNMISLGSFDGSVCLVSRRLTFPRNSICSRRFWSGKCLKYVGVCSNSVTTNYIERENSLTLDSTHRGSSKGNDTDRFFTANPNPVLESESEIDPLRSTLWGESKVDKEDEISEVIESLGEILEKVEKLETSKKVNNVSVNNKHSPYGTANQKDGRAVVNSIENSNRKSKARKNHRTVVKVVENSDRKSKTVKSVWLKGNPVGTMQRVIRKPKKQEPPVGPPQEIQPKLQSRPSVTPGSSIQKPAILGLESNPIGGSESGLAPETKERKTILIDKFASKKPVVDPLRTKAVLAPPKPRKAPGPGPGPSKFKNDFRKKSSLSGGPRRRMVNNDDDDNARRGRKWSKASRRAVRLQAEKAAAPVRVEIMEVNEDGMLTEELSHNLAVGEGKILGYLHSKGIRPDGVQKLSKDVVKMICKEYEVEVIDAAPLRVEEKAKKKKILEEDDLDKLEDRPPVITIMGHVDHGKTTLLDCIRKSKVAAGEAGGITQGIGAYKVQVPIDGKKQTCVFLDTPGHEAFGAMRARGARVTDIAVIVVAADDGIRPQTSEAIAHAKAAGVPIIVAINKIDMDGANPDRVIQDLSAIGLMPEEWGGGVPMVKISALKGENVDNLLETIMLLAEFEELKANPHRNAKGTVIEAGLDKSKGPVATFIVQNGTLRRGDILACGEAFGKVRALFDDNEKRVDEAGPSLPVQVIGLNNVPLAGDEFEVVGSLDIARERAESRAEYLRNERITEKTGDGKITLASYASAVSSGKTAGLDLHQLNIILKVDVQGTIEAVKQALHVLPQDNITLKFLLQATGDLSTSDVDLAVASKAIVFGFNVKAPGSVKSYANNRNVEIRLYKVIYELIDDMRNAMEGLLDLVEEQVPIGSAEVRAIFSSGSGRVAGCMVTEGKLVKGCGIRVLRKRKEIHVGVLSSLKRVKEIVNEVNAGLECGVGIEGFNEWEAGDIIETFNTVQKKRTLEEASASISAALEKQGYKSKK